MPPIKPIALDGVTSYSLKDRRSKVGVDQFAEPWSPDGSVARWMRTLPRILAAGDFAQVVEGICTAVRGGRAVVLAMGAHVIKVGLGPVIIDLMERGILSGVAMNGACIIHDAEVAMVGRTSEDVAAVLGEGKFGMARETAEFLNGAVNNGAARDEGLGLSVGRALSENGFPHNRSSILARAYELGVPVTVHVALGTDIIHFHPTADGAAIGKTSHTDFRIFARLVSGLEEGVFINLGSAVVLPEVFLKAVSLVRNLGHPVKRLTTVNMDFIRQYRSFTNVVHRPTLEGGKGYNLIGHHEIMFPLLAAAVLDRLRGK